MIINLEKYKNDLENLIKLSDSMLFDIRDRKTDNKKCSKDYNNIFEQEYQNWYTIAHSVIKQIIPQRLYEFENLYLTDSKRKTIERATFSIQDWINGYRLPNIIWEEDYDIDDIDIVIQKFQTQKYILESASQRFENSLFDIRKIVQADLFDSEIDAAKELMKNGFLRASGAIVGVLLEKHLNEICTNHNIKMNKKNPGISDYNELLKSNNAIEIPTWRFIQRLGDIRNLCDHSKNQEPQEDDINELINGVDKILKTIF